MNLDFRKLDRANQIKAIEEVINQDSTDFLAFLIQDSSMDIYGWFNFSSSKDGEEYWFNVKEKVNKE